MPIRPPIKTLKKSNQKLLKSLSIFSLERCPKTPEIELININNDAVVAMTFGLSTFNKKRIGLKKIPPPIPTIPDIKPRVEPIMNEKKKV